MTYEAKCGILILEIYDIGLLFFCEQYIKMYQYKQEETTSITLRVKHTVDPLAFFQDGLTEDEENTLLAKADYEDAMAAAEILTILRHSKAVEFQMDDKDNTIIVSPSLRHEGLQLTYFDRYGPVSHSSKHDPLEIAKELANEFLTNPPVKVTALDYERSEPQMQFINSYYVSPNGGKIDDGLNAVGDLYSLKCAEAALVSAGIVHVFGEPTERTIVVSDNKLLTQGQISTLQETILESLKAGADVTIRTLDDRSTTLVEENTWKIAQITGYLVNNGEFAQGDYTGERARAEQRELEESLRRSDRVAYER